MTDKQTRLCERLKRLGYTRQNQIKLHGLQFELTGHPVLMTDTVVFVDGVERNSGEPMRVRLPLMIVRMAGEETFAA